jgi:HEAT repeat protein
MRLRKNTLVAVFLVLMVPVLEAQEAAYGNQNTLRQITSEFSTLQLDGLLANTADSPDAARLNALTQSLSTAKLSLSALTKSQHLIIRLYALRELQFRFFSAWDVDIKLIHGLIKVYSDQDADWRLRTFAADCLARWFSSASYAPDVRKRGVQFVTATTEAEAGSKLENAITLKAAHQKPRDESKGNFISLLIQEIKGLIAQNKVKGESKVRLNKAMTQARILGDHGFVDTFAEIAEGGHLPIGARQGAVEILGEIGDSSAWPVVERYYQQNKSGSYYDRRIALSTMSKINSQRVVEFIQQSLKSPVSDRELHDLEFKYMDYASPQKIERTFEEYYGSMRDTILREDWQVLKEVLRTDNGDKTDSLIKFLTRTSLIKSESRRAIMHLFDYLSSSTYSKSVIGTTNLLYFARAIDNYKSLFELDAYTLTQRRDVLLRLLERPGRKNLHQYLRWSAIEVLSSGRVPNVALSELLVYINDPKFGLILANRLSHSKRFGPSQVIHNLPSNLDRNGAANVVRFLEGQGWESLSEILSALDSRVIAIAKADQRGESIPFPLNRIGGYREILSLQVILEQILEGLPQSALPLIVDYISSDSFRIPISNIADTLKVTLAQNSIVTLPILTTLLSNDLSVSSQQFLRQIVIDQGPRALNGIKDFLKTETPERLALVSDITSSQTFRGQLEPPLKTDIDSTLTDVKFTIIVRKIKALFTKVFVDEVIGFGMLVIMLTAFRRAVFSRIEFAFSKLVDLLRFWLTTLIKPSVLVQKFWAPAFVARSPNFWKGLQNHDLSDLQLETLLLKCINSGPEVIDALAAWSVRKHRTARIAELPEINKNLIGLVLKILMSTAKQAPANFQNIINETSIFGSIQAIKAKDELFNGYIKPRLTLLETVGLTEEKELAISQELQVYAKLFAFGDRVPDTKLTGSE